jgi:hypothetical protein
MYESYSVDVAVASLDAAVEVATEQAISRDYNRQSKFPPRFTNNLINYFVNKKSFHRCFKKK